MTAGIATTKSHFYDRFVLISPLLSAWRAIRPPMFFFSDRRDGESFVPVGPKGALPWHGDYLRRLGDGTKRRGGGGGGGGRAPPDEESPPLQLYSWDTGQRASSCGIKTAGFHISVGTEMLAGVSAWRQLSVANGKGNENCGRRASNSDPVIDRSAVAEKTARKRSKKRSGGSRPSGPRSSGMASSAADKSGRSKNRIKLYRAKRHVVAVCVNRPV